MPSPIIIPVMVPQTRQIDCIVQDGVRYCENQPVTKEEGAALALLILYVGGFCWLCTKDVPGWVLLGYFIAPFALFLLAMIL